MSTPYFIKSAARAADFPADVGREVAFVGRSNSGKSTALNALTGVAKLARVSKTPGRTQLVNFFALGPERRLVDLPGYGFARAAPEVRARWRELIEGYLHGRRSLAGLVVTLDIRRGLTPLDVELLGFVAPLGRPVGVLLTKADKLSRAAGLEVERRIVGEVGPGVRVARFSALERVGVDTGRAWLAEWLAPDPAGGATPA